jgi:hypothetical protein
MAATLSGAIKAHIEAQGLGVPVDRDEATQGRTYPYVVVREAFDSTKDPGSNAYSGDHRISELVQVDLFDVRKRSATQQTVENYTLPDALARVLNGVRLDTAPTKVYGMTLVGRTRIVETQRIHHVFTAQVRRKF